MFTLAAWGKHVNRKHNATLDILLNHVMGRRDPEGLDTLTVVTDIRPPTPSSVPLSLTKMVEHLPRPSQRGNLSCPWSVRVMTGADRRDPG